MGLDRPNVRRVNLCLRKETYRTRFGPQPQRPPKGGVVSADYDLTVPDRIMPHPVYGWICILNPSEDSFEALRPLIRESYE